MSRLLWCLLSLVLDRTLNENGFLKHAEKRSQSLRGLFIDFEEILDLYHSSNSDAVGKAGFKVIQEIINNMKISKPGSNMEKNVIPVIAFDEADILSKSTFEIEVPVSATGFCIVEQKTFRYISFDQTSSEHLIRTNYVNAHLSS